MISQQQHWIPVKGNNILKVLSKNNCQTRVFILINQNKEDQNKDAFIHKMTENIFPYKSPRKALLKHAFKQEEK